MRLETRAARPALAAAGAGAAIAVLATACGGGGSSTSSASPASPTASPQPTKGAEAEKAITADWEAFFNASTPSARRVVLLQNGQAFTTALNAQAASPIAQNVTAKVNKVVIVSPTQARVTYTVTSAGSPVLRDQSGIAVYQKGLWRVGVASFCGLLAMESGGNTSSLPSACRSGG